MLQLLKNIKVLVTRPKQQADNLRQLIESQGGEAVLFPTLEIEPVVKNNVITDCLKNLNSYQWVIFISRNAVNFAQALNNGKMDCFVGLNIAAVGKATAQALNEVGLKTNTVPEQGFNSEALLAMPQLQQIEGQQVLIVRGVGGRELLAQTLKQRGANVDYLEVYQRKQPEIDKRPVLDLLQEQSLSVITINSGEALKNLMLMLNEATVFLLLLPLVVISDRIKQQAIEMGFKQVFVSASPADSSVLETIITVCNGEDSG